MKKKINRREFMKSGLKTSIATLALSACGKIYPFDLYGQEMFSELEVKEDLVIAPLNVLEAAQSLPFVYKGKKSILLYNDGEIRAFENICTHKQGPTELKKDLLQCKWHGSKFDPTTGEAIGGPAPQGTKLPAIDVIIRDNMVYVDAKDSPLEEENQ